MLTVLCQNFPWIKNLKINRFFYEKLFPIAKSYDFDFNDLVCSLAVPSTKYYVRVNLLKTSVEKTIKQLKDEGHEFHSDGKIEEAIYTKINGPKLDISMESTNIKGFVIADRFAAESVMLGADLYSPGVISVNANEGEEVKIMDPNGTIVGIGRLEVNPLKKKLRSGIAVKVKSSPYSAPKIRNTKAFQDGLIYDQTYPSQIIPYILDVNEDDIVLDMTASPGGKTTHAYEKSRGKAKIVAVDHTNSKIERILKNIKRLGHNRITVIKVDSRKISEKLKEMRPNKIILDPPCTGLGNRPRLNFILRKEDLLNLVNLQRRLISEASRIIAPGGIISYSTCTLTIEENEGIVEWAKRELGLKPMEPSWPVPFSPFLYGKAIRFQPPFHDTPGFFAALLTKE